MQDSGAPTTIDIQQPVQQVSSIMRGQQQKAPETITFKNENDRVIPSNDDGAKAPKSKFGAVPLSPQQLNEQLGVSHLDQKEIKIDKAWYEDDEVKIKLKNGDTISVGRDSNGYASIKAPARPDGGPVDATSLMAMTEIAKAKGWKSIDVHGNGEDYRALSFLAITGAGLKMEDPPAMTVVDKYRERFQIAKTTGVDPVAQAHREKLAAAKLAGDKPSSPAIKSPDPQPVSLKRPVRAAGMKM